MSNSKLDFFRLLKTSIESINPRKLVQDSITRTSQTIRIPEKFGFKNQKTCDEFVLNKNVYLAAFGKAALGMALEMERVIDKDLVKGIAIVPFNEAEKIKNQHSKIEFFYGGKFNLPDNDSVSATKNIYQMVSSLTQNDLFIALTSGGGSALLTLPEVITDDEAKNFDLKLQTIKKIVQSGATINELNTVRSCLSRIKNGKLAFLSHPATTISLVISDVIDDPLEIISSGPCCVQSVYSPSKQAEKALEVLEKHELFDKIPVEVFEFLKNKSQSEPDPKIDEFIKNEKVFNYLIGNNRLATLAIYNDLSNQVYGNDFKIILTNSLNGEAKSIGSLYAFISYFMIKIRSREMEYFSHKSQLTSSILSLSETDLNEKDLIQLDSLIEIFVQAVFENKEFKNLITDKDRGIKMCFISGGETTVNMTSCTCPGKGGRNQEFTLAFEHTFLKLLSKDKVDAKFDLLFSSYGSDGIDGPTDAAGAYYSFESADLKSERINEMVDYLKTHDSYNYFQKYNRLVITGPTGTNVSDLQVLLLNF